MLNNNLAKKQDILKCLEARSNGIHIQEANQYITELEVINYFS